MSIKEGSPPQMSQSFLLFFHNLSRILGSVPSICTCLLFTCPCFFGFFFFVPSPVMAPKCHQSLVELEDKIEGSGVRPQSMTPPLDLHRSQPLSSDLGLGPPLEEPSPKLLTPPEWSKKLKRGKQSK